jgi:hypothetical protein
VTAARIKGEIKAQVHADHTVCLLLWQLTGDIEACDTPWSAAATAVPNQDQQCRSS